jgi:DNA repair exonuclease SbcCD ATPase subunit
MNDDLIERLSNLGRVLEEQWILDAAHEVERLREDLRIAKSVNEKRWQEIDRLRDELANCLHLDNHNAIVRNLNEQIQVAMTSKLQDWKDEKISQLEDQIEHMSVAIENSASMAFAYKQEQEIERLRELCVQRITEFGELQTALEENERLRGLVRMWESMSEKEELERLREDNRGWLAANAPGGWIDDLRKENQRLRWLLREGLPWSRLEDWKARVHEALGEKDGSA